MNIRNIIILVIFNLIILAELVFSLYQASKDPENVTLIFIQYFVLLIVPTFIVGRIVIKKLIKRKTEDFSQIITEDFSKQKELYSILQENEKNIKDLEVLNKPSTVKSILKKRAIFGKLGVLFLLLMAFSFLDGCVNRLLHPMNLINTLPGQTIKVNAPLEKKVSDVSELSYTTTSELIKIQFESIYSGFWIGGTEWRGLLSVDPKISPGEYKVTINIKGTENKRPFMFVIRVHESIESLNRSSMSLITRAIGVSPWLVFVSSIILIALTILIILKLSNRMEEILLQNGQAEVFFVRRGEYLTEIVFGLGKRDNVKVGDILNLYNENGVPVGKVIVQQTTNENSLGIVKAEHFVKPGYIVSLRKN
ncbi:MAG: hypothetical protein NZ845_04995 [Thermodesulfovibrio sp.]|nr:hypothetical protein [Thermodesulfovibrio sp.]MDW7971674.1 hypothetical protein [Thermodesulfovibrio sp.]